MLIPSKVGKYVVVVAAAVSLGTGAITIKTDTVLDPYVDTEAVEVAYKESNIKTKEQVYEPLKATSKQEESESTSNDDANEKNSTNYSNDWYSDVPSDVNKEGKVINNLSGAIHMYDGLPWKINKETFFFDFPKARSDVAKLLQDTGGTDQHGTPMWNNSNNATVSKFDTHHMVDGVDAMCMIMRPTFVDPDWYDTKWVNDAYSEKDHDSSFKYLIKLVIVLCEKSKDKKDPKNWVYIPTTKADSDGHNWPIGVLYTNVSYNGSNHTAVPHSTGKSYDFTKECKSKDREAILKTLQKDVNMALWASGWFECYCQDYNARMEIANKYDVVGLIYMGDMK